MPEKLSKIQARALILSTLSKYRSLRTPSSEQIASDIEELSAIDDNDLIAKVLFKEIASNDLSEYINVCAIILLEIIENNIFEKYAFDFLKNKNNTDEKKFFVISLIKQKGIYFDYDNIEDYIENPEAVEKNGIKGFLLNMPDDYEAQVDLLDFYLNIPEGERIFLLNNLSKENNTDSVAYTMSILAQLKLKDNELDIIINTLLEVDTPYTIEGLEHILENYSVDLKLRQKIKNKLKKIKDKYPDFKNNTDSKETIINDCYISFIDGNSNFSIILSKKSKENLIDAVFISANINCGILACMGFSCITLSNYNTILSRLFPDILPIKIKPSDFKSIYEYCIKLNKQTNTDIPYELIIWSKLFEDIQGIDCDFKDFIISKLDKIKLNEEKIKRFFLSKANDCWFFEYGQNEAIDKIIDKIEKEHILEYNDIENIVSDSIDDCFINDDKFREDIVNRLIFQAYIFYLADLKVSSNCAYSLSFKNEYFRMFVKILIYKSIYQYLINMQEELLKKDNIFRKKIKCNFNNDELEGLIAKIENKWKLKKE